MWTVGHSTHALEDFVALVRAHGVTHVADVRKLPRSRRHPQFNIDTLPETLGAAGLGYTHFAGLGGLRHEQPDSINRALKNPSFRAYADYMQTPMFAAELDRLVALERRDRVAIMCAEAVWWRCHRSFIADALVARGEEVRHILTPGRAEPHTLRDFARVVDGRVTYPGEPELF
ncbi:MAG TPA: DUF488 domain-containing protein [Methylomirabilota bacterium]|nr:DUF488 domain-containing protein [Methylomirabilota bacterium]